MIQQKFTIYQIFTRLFENHQPRCTYQGSIEENGCGKFNRITDTVLNYIHNLGITHVWYTGIIAHATQTDYTAYGIPLDHPAVVKGKAGSPYAIKDYYDVDPDLAEDIPNRMKEFEALVARTHANGMKVIIDFVPNHVARQYHSTQKPQGVKDLGEDDDRTVAFAPDNNFYYLPGQTLEGEINLHHAAMGTYVECPAKATGNNRFDAHPNTNDWYETVKLNYGTDYFYNTGNHFSPTPDTWKKMRDILLFWAEKGIDGFRCDMAEMVPCEFWEWVIPEVKSHYPDLIFIAEVYNPNEYRNYLHRGHFDYLYNKVGLYDTLRAVTCGQASATQITWSWQTIDDIQPRMLHFLENHDEQRIASRFFAGNPFRAIPALIVSACMNTAPVMIYFGQEIGEPGMDDEGFSGIDGRTTIFDYWSVETLRRRSNGGRYNGALLNEQEKVLESLYARILHLSLSEPAIARGTFFDLMYVNCNGWQMNEHKQYAFLRKQDNDLIFIVVNFSDLQSLVHVNLPQHAFDYLGIEPQESCSALELLTQTRHEISFTPAHPTMLDLAPYSGKILKIKV